MPPRLLACNAEPYPHPNPRRMKPNPVVSSPFCPPLLTCCLDCEHPLPCTLGPAPRPCTSALHLGPASLLFASPRLICPAHPHLPCALPCAPSSALHTYNIHSSRLVRPCASALYPLPLCVAPPAANASVSFYLPEGRPSMRSISAQARPACPSSLLVRLIVFQLRLFGWKVLYSVCPYRYVHGKAQSTRCNIAEEQVV